MSKEFHFRGVVVGSPLRLHQIQYLLFRVKTPSSSFQRAPGSRVNVSSSDAVLSNGWAYTLIVVWAREEKLELVLCCNLQSVKGLNGPMSKSVMIAVL